MADPEVRIQRLEEARRALRPRYEKAPDQKRVLAMVERELRRLRQARQAGQIGSDRAS